MTEYSQSFILEEDNIISNKLLDLLANNNLEPLETFLNNYWFYSCFKFILTKNKSDNKIYFVFLDFNDNLLEIIENENKNNNKKMPEYCCFYSLNNRTYQIGNFHLLFFNQFRILKYPYEYYLQHKNEINFGEK